MKALKGMNYPTSKQDLVQKAKQNNTSQDVIQTIENLPQDQFKSPTDIQKAWGQ
ncbi:DUF2795 domain-containing protein [Methanobacterium sp. MBAC-LM]|jgi:hypothetical protein|uniref:DUF2795 domain-containing protein n=1 Tax=Methanobacterium sp. MBAC-LM TaxID=3412034 RepID=UPI003C72669C